MVSGRGAARRTVDDLGVAYTWGDGPEVVVLSNPLADPVAWSTAARGDLLRAGHRVTTFEHRPERDDWRSVVACVSTFVERRESPVCLVVGFELDADTFAARAREVAAAISGAEYLELPGLGHAAPATEPHQVWPPVLGFFGKHPPA